MVGALIGPALLARRWREVKKRGSVINRLDGEYWVCSDVDNEGSTEHAVELRIVRVPQTVIRGWDEMSPDLTGSSIVKAGFAIGTLLFAATTVTLPFWVESGIAGWATRRHMFGVSVGSWYMAVFAGAFVLMMVSAILLDTGCDRARVTYLRREVADIPKDLTKGNAGTWGGSFTPRKYLLLPTEDKKI